MEREMRSAQGERAAQPPRGLSPAWPYPAAGLAAAVAFQLCIFLQTLWTPWTSHVDFNGAVWSQAAHNLLAAGFGATAGVPAPFYFGPLPIPPGGYYCHHPSLFPLMIAGAFAVFGESEWAARLVPILFSTASVILLWLLVKSCAGSAAASFSAMLFAALPMELRFGQMVNFEPCALTWMLAGFLGLRYAGLTGLGRWKTLALFGFGMAMQTAWLGYFAAGALCLWFCWRGRFRAALALALIAAGSAALFLAQMRLVEPNLFHDLAAASLFRFGHNLSGGHSFTFWQWAARVSARGLNNIPPGFVALSLPGLACLWRWRNREGARALAWVCAIVAGMNAVYVAGFRNASYVHDYASFYFALPAAVLAGLGAHWLSAQAARAGRGMGVAAGGALLVGMALYGGLQTESLRTQAHILDLAQSEPQRLIPALGKAIRAEFPPDAKVLTNIGAYFTPQLWYYSGRQILNNLTLAAHWRHYSAANPRTLDGIVWLGAPGAAEILKATQGCEQKTVLIEGVPFCLVHKPR